MELELRTKLRLAYQNQQSFNKANEILIFIIFNCHYNVNNDNEDLKKSQIIKMIDDLYNLLFCADASFDDKLISVDYECFGVVACSDKDQAENEIYKERLYNYENPKVFHMPHYISCILTDIFYEIINMQQQAKNNQYILDDDFLEKIYNLDEYEFITIILYHALLKNETKN